MPPKIGEFLGLQNYVTVINGYYFFEALRNTLFFTSISVPTIVLTALGISLLLNKKFRGVSFVITCLLLPWSLSSAATGMLWRWLFMGNGLINKVLITLGILKEPIYFLASRDTQLLIFIIAHLWHELPFATVILYAALQLVPRELIEASHLDGANVFQRFRYVTYPFIKVMIVVVAIFEIMVSFTMYDIAYSLTGGVWGLLSYYCYAESFNWGNFGTGGALAVIISLTFFIVMFIVLRLFPIRTIYKGTLLGE
ncbi:MAG: sugar ABC transporter permease [Candidatus Methanomethylicia archaeon]